MPMVLSDGEQVNDSASLGLCLAAEVHQVPSGAGASAVGNQPFGHGAGPLGGVLCFLARTEFAMSCHSILRTAALTGRGERMRASGPVERVVMRPVYGGHDASRAMAR